MKECIILAGGLGTRLKSVVSNVPKCMAEVAGLPFLSYLLDYAKRENFDRVILSLGYKSNIVLDWIKSHEYSFNISFVIEDQPLGTGGAIRLAFEQVISTEAYVLNGDTFFDIDTDKLSDFHRCKKSSISLALKPMIDFYRYGSVSLASNMRILQFNEKKHCTEGLINGGVYLIDKDIFAKNELPEKFSFEKDIMELRVDDIAIYGLEFNNYFIDIGIPSDFEKANIDFNTINKETK